MNEIIIRNGLIITETGRIQADILKSVMEFHQQLVDFYAGSQKIVYYRVFATFNIHLQYIYFPVV